mgnify:FL=1
MEQESVQERGAAAWVTEDEHGAIDRLSSEGRRPQMVGGERCGVDNGMGLFESEGTDGAKSEAEGFQDDPVDLEVTIHLTLPRRRPG